MLVSLKIKNIALIDEVKIEFSNGFNVLTGETGAGKSIIIDALNFVLGAKADKTLIKANCDFSFVEGVFEIDKSNEEIISIFDSFSIECDDYVCIQRRLNINGKNECRINGELVTLSMLKKLTVMLVDIFGQHDHQLLLDTKNHLLMLDTVCTKNLEVLNEELKIKLQDLKQVNNSIEELGGDDDSRKHEIELLEHEINQIEEANLSEKEEDELLQNKALLNNSEKIFNHINSCNKLFRENDIINTIKSAVSDLQEIKQYDNSLDSNVEKLLEMRYQLEDIMLELKEFERGVYYSEEEINKIEDRLQYIKDIKRKFGRTIADVLEYLNSAKEKKFMLENCEEQLAKLHKEKSIILKNIYDISKNITSERKTAAEKLEKNMLIELKELGIKNASFKVLFADDYTLENIESKISRNGTDRLEFLFSANLGQPLKPLNKIISGGEMSRLMLAFKCVIKSADSFKTYIFDEIDTGIGGAIGMVLAKKLASIARLNQVICVTHLSQIAVFADYQFKITKHEQDGVTHTNVLLLSEKERISELTRMIGTMENAEFAELHASELIKESNNYKQSLL